MAEDHVYRKTEIVGSSRTGIEEAIKNGIGRARKTIRHVDWFEVTEIRGTSAATVIRPTSIRSHQ